MPGFHPPPGPSCYLCMVRGNIYTTCALRARLFDTRHRPGFKGGSAKPAADAPTPNPQKPKPAPARAWACQFKAGYAWPGIGPLLVYCVPKPHLHVPTRIRLLRGRLKPGGQKSGGEPAEITPAPGWLLHAPAGRRRPCCRLKASISNGALKPAPAAGGLEPASVAAGLKPVSVMAPWGRLMRRPAWSRLV